MLNTDMVNHPPHYNFAGPAYETSRVIRAWNLDFHRGNAVKYIARAGKKDGSLAKEIEDIEKAVWYLTDDLKYLKERQEKENAAANLRKYPEHLREAAINVLGHELDDCSDAETF